jgi:UDP-N-acetyl-2-amino-2-deoxyglucuronate dehydrogenase
VLRVGFLGAGFIAAFHSKLLRSAPTPFVRAGVYDLDPDRTAAFARVSGHHPCRSEAEVLDSCDAVFVCTWTSEHRRLVEAAAERELAVFVEKPLATSLAEAEALCEAVDRWGVVNQVGLVLRRSPAVRALVHLSTEPAAGRVLAVVFRDDQFIPVQGRYASTWRADRARAGAGTLLEHSIHDLDVLTWLAGPVRSVSCTTRNHHGHPGIEDVAQVSLQHAGGAVASLTSVWHDNLARPSLRRVEVLCERRFVTLAGDDWLGPVQWEDADGTTGSLEGALLEHEVPLAGPRNPADAFLVAATTGAPAWPDVHTALDAHRLADACYRSAGAGGAPVALEAEAA